VKKLLLLILMPVAALLVATPLLADDLKDLGHRFHFIQPCNQWSNVRLPSGKWIQPCTYRGSGLRVINPYDLNRILYDFEDRIEALEGRIKELESGEEN